MKTLTFEKKEILEPLAINKDEVAKFTLNGKLSILLNGITTHIISARELVRYDSDILRNCIQSVLTEVFCNGKNSYELAFDGQYSISITDNGDNYVIQMYKTSPIYENE